MDEYNGSLRDSQKPCDIDKSFIEPCSNGISAKFSLDVEISDLSDDRITECQSIINDFTPMHSILHTLNFTGKFEDIILPPIEQYEALIHYNQDDYCIAGMAQYVLNRAMYLGLDQNAVYRNELATQWSWYIIEGTDAYNQAITLFCSEVNFQTLGVRDVDTETLLEVLSPSANSGEYCVQNPNANFIDVSQTIPVNETPSLNKSSFTFRLSNINLADSNFTAAQANIYKLNDDSVVLSDYAIKTVWDVNNGYAAQAWQVILPTGTYDILDMHDDVLIIEDDGTLSNVSATGVNWSLLSPTATELTSSNGNYVVEVIGKITIDPSLNYNNVNTLIDGSGYFYLDSTTYWVLDGALIDYGVATGTPTTFQIFRYSKESIQLFGEQLYDVSRLGQEIYDYAVNYSFSMMENMTQLAMKPEKPGISDSIKPQEFINIKIEYADGRVETGEI